MNDDTTKILAAHAIREAIAERRRAAIREAVAAITPIMVDEYYWQRNQRGAGHYAALREVIDITRDAGNELVTAITEELNKQSHRMKLNVVRP